MKALQVIPKVEVTSDYDIFYTLEGNRDVADFRKDKIIKSIKKVGYIPSPIIVNEKFEVIDGQGRLGALRELNLPVYYIVIPGLTIEHCVAMNINLSNWSFMDFIKSYADQGNENYQNFLSCIENHKSLKYDVVSLVCAGNSRGFDTYKIKDGSLYFPSSAMKYAENTLNYLEVNLLPLRDKISGRFSYLCAAVVFAMKHTDADMNRLIRLIRSNIYDLSAIANVESALKEIERIYNQRLSTKKIYFLSEYDKWITEIRRISGKLYRERCIR